MSKFDDTGEKRVPLTFSPGAHEYWEWIRTRYAAPQLVSVPPARDRLKELSELLVRVPR